MSYTVLLPFWVISEAPVLLTPSGDMYWGTKVQRNLPNNNHFALSSSLFAWCMTCEIPYVMIIFKMVSLWEKSFFPLSQFSGSWCNMPETLLMQLKLKRGELWLHPAFMSLCFRSWNLSESGIWADKAIYFFLLLTMFYATLQLNVFQMQPVNSSLWKSPEHSQKSRYKNTQYTKW